MNSSPERVAICTYMCFHKGRERTLPRIGLTRETASIHVTLIRAV